MQYSKHFATSDLQFGFKPGYSTDLCSNPVYSCFLDASKAFDRVDHLILLSLLLKKNLPPIILRFLFSWYQMQFLSICLNTNFSTKFGVSNGVRPEEAGHG